MRQHTICFFPHTYLESTVYVVVIHFNDRFSKLFTNYIFFILWKKGLNRIAQQLLKEYQIVTNNQTFTLYCNFCILLETSVISGTDKTVPTTYVH
jgi:hypothetical protein